MELCDEEDIELESMLEWIVCGRLEGEERQRCEEILKDRYSSLLRCSFPTR